MTNTPTIGMQIQAIRLDLGLTGTAFAEAINAAAPGSRVNRFTVSRWESGRITPSPAMLAVIKSLGSTSEAHQKDHEQ